MLREISGGIILLKYHSSPSSPYPLGPNSLLPVTLLFTSRRLVSRGLVQMARSLWARMFLRYLMDTTLSVPEAGNEELAGNLNHAGSE